MGAMNSFLMKSAGLIQSGSFCSNVRVHHQSMIRFGIRPSITPSAPHGPSEKEFHALPSERLS